MLSGGNVRRASPSHQSEEMKILNIAFPQMVIELITCRSNSHKLVTLRHDWPHSILQIIPYQKYNIKIFIQKFNIFKIICTLTNSICKEHIVLRNAAIINSR